MEITRMKWDTVSVAALNQFIYALAKELKKAVVKMFTDTATKFD